MFVTETRRDTLDDEKTTQAQKAWFDSARHTPSVDQLKALLERYPNLAPTSTDKQGNNFLHYLAQNRKPKQALAAFKIVLRKTLLAQPKKKRKPFSEVLGGLLTQKNIHGNTPLHEMAYRGMFPARALSSLDALIEDWALPNAQGETPLHLAIRYRSKDFFDLLLTQEADLTAQNNDGNRPLHLAIKAGAFDWAKQLITAGASLTAKNKQGKTPLQMTTNPKSQRQLLAHHRACQLSSNALLAAVSQAQLKVAKWLVEPDKQGTNVEAKLDVENNNPHEKSSLGDPSSSLTSQWIQTALPSKGSPTDDTLDNTSASKPLQLSASVAQFGRSAPEITTQLTQAMNKETLALVTKRLHAKEKNPQRSTERLTTMVSILQDPQWLARYFTFSQVKVRKSQWQIAQGVLKGTLTFQNQQQMRIHCQLNKTPPLDGVKWRYNSQTYRHYPTMRYTDAYSWQYVKDDGQERLRTFNNDRNGHGYTYIGGPKQGVCQNLIAFAELWNTLAFQIKACNDAEESSNCILQ